MHEDTSNHDSQPAREPMPLFAWIAVTFTLAVTAASLFVMKIVAGL